MKEWKRVVFSAIIGAIVGVAAAKLHDAAPRTCPQLARDVEQCHMSFRLSTDDNTDLRESLAECRRIVGARR